MRERVLQMESVKPGKTLNSSCLRRVIYTRRIDSALVRLRLKRGLSYKREHRADRQ